MTFTRIEIVFIATGAVLGAAVAWASQSGTIGKSDAFPPFVLVLLALGLIEVAASLATNRVPGALVAMPARILAFAVGIGVLALITGSLA